MVYTLFMNVYLHCVKHNSFYKIPVFRRSCIKHFHQRAFYCRVLAFTKTHLWVKGRGNSLIYPSHFMKFSHDVIYRFPSLVVYFNPDTAITTDDFIQGERHRFSNRHRNTLQLWRNQILHFSMPLAQVASFHIFCNIASILCLKGLSAHFWYVESLPRWDAVALDLQLSPIPS